MIMLTYCPWEECLQNKNEDSIQMQVWILYVEVKKHLEAETMTV